MKLFEWLRAAKPGGVPAVLPQPAASAVTAEQSIALGNDLEDRGLLDDALRHYEEAIAHQPGFARAHLNRGNVLLAKGDPAGALSAYETACQHAPDYAPCYLNIGNLHMRLHRPEPARDAYEKALALQPDLIDAAVGRAAALEEMQQPVLAAAAYRDVLAAAPGYAEIHGNLGAVLARLGKYSEALESLQRCVQLRPEHAYGQHQLANLQKDLGLFEAAIASYTRAIACAAQDTDLRSSLLFSAHYGQGEPAGDLNAAVDFGALVARKSLPFTDWPSSPQAERRLRIGLVSGDFRQHPVGDFLDGVLNAVRSRHSHAIELIGYANHHANDDMTARLKASCSDWQVVTQLSDAALAARIRQDEIDILIDLSGHTGFNRLPVFAWKPAPVQATWLGYFSTTGVAAIDYFIADPVTLRQTEEKDFTETVWRLPQTRLCFTPPVDALLAPGPLPALANGHVTFGCFNHLSKMNDAVVAVWARLLCAVPGSRLFLKSPPLGDVQIRLQTIARFSGHGVDASRLLFEGLTAKPAYLAAYRQVDIALDPFPYPGGTTTMEALWMGVPVLTMEGNRFLSRQGVGLLKNAALDAWIATDENDYVARGVTHAADLAALAALRARLRAQVLASPLCDAPRFAADLTAALRDMWRLWCRERT